MPAPKHNLFALGHHFGRPKKYATAKELYDECKAYFDWCIEAKEVLTVTGLCIYLDVSRQTVSRWIAGEIDTKEDVFSDIIKKAMAIVENSYEKKLDTFTFGGAIFALKNINKEYWKDKTETENTNLNTNVEANFGNTLHTPSESVNDSQRDKE